LEDNVKKVVLSMLSILLVVSLYGCAPAAPTPAPKLEPIYIAIAVPLTGNYAQYGQYFLTSAQIRIDEANAAGGVKGRKLVLESYDDRGDIAEGSNLAQKISDDPKYIAVIGGFTSTSVLASAPIYGKNKIVQMVPAASHQDITKVSQYSWVQSSVATEMRNMFNMVVDGIGSKKIAYIFLNNDSGLSALKLVQGFVAERKDVELVAYQSYNEGQVSDYTPLLSKIKEANPETIMISAQYKDVAAILTQAKQIGFGTTKFANLSTAYSDEFLKLAGSAAEGFYVSTLYFADNPEPGVQSFAKKFKEASGGKTANMFASQAYESASMLVYALEQGATDRASLYDQMLKIKLWKGLTYTAEFTDRVPARVGVSIMVKDGKWVVADFKK
jgi:branched-chain amino acid transport system substrate-binding protein